MKTLLTCTLLAISTLLGGCDDKPEPAKPEPVKPEPVKPEPAKIEPTMPASKVPETTKRDPATPAPSQTNPTHSNPTHSNPAQTKPTDTNPSETNPAHTQEVQTKPEGTKSFATPQPTLETMNVTLDGKTFKLEKAANDEQRFRGLSGRASIADDGGMIFLFKAGSRQSFVMRDCAIPIDIVYVDATARITAMYNMQPEAERTEAEKVLPTDTRIPEWARTNDAYEARLKKYSSRYDAIVVIELKGGTLNIEGSNPKGLNLKVGQKLDLDMPLLRKLAK